VSAHQWIMCDCVRLIRWLRDKQQTNYTWSVHAAFSGSISNCRLSFLLLPVSWRIKQRLKRQAETCIPRATWVGELHHETWGQ